MRKIIATVSSLGMTLGMALSMSVALPTAAHADGLPDLCKAYIDGGGTFYASVGECVASVRTQGAKVCEQIKDLGLFPLNVGGGVVLKNKGDCVSYINAYYRGLINP